MISKLNIPKFNEAFPLTKFRILTAEESVQSIKGSLAKGAKVVEEVNTAYAKKHPHAGQVEEGLYGENFRSYVATQIKNTGKK